MKLINNSASKWMLGKFVKTSDKNDTDKAFYKEGSYATPRGIATFYYSLFNSNYALNIEFVCCGKLHHLVFQGPHQISDQQIKRMITKYVEDIVERSAKNEQTATAKAVLMKTRDRIDSLIEKL